MDIRASTPLAVPPERVFAEVADLTTYPGWLTIVGAVEGAAPHEADVGPAWFVELQARIGPLTRRKRVRMVRTRYEPPSAVRFERVEHDEEGHSRWILAAEVGEPPGEGPGASAAPGAGSRLDMHLHYSGGGLALIEVVIREEIRRAGRRLESRLR